jgi:hypothetical protein
MVRGRVKKAPLAPWPAVVLDSQGLWVVARNDDEDARAVLAASSRTGVPVLVSAAVLAETQFGDERDARANVVATAEAAGGGLILTSDPGDIGGLSDCVTDTRIRPVRVS